MINTLKSLVRRTPRSIAVVGLAGAAALAVVGGPVAAADATVTGCTTAACITNVSLQPGGLTAAIVFDTAVATTDHFELSSNNTVIAHADYATAVTHHQLTSTATLQPNTSYTWLLQVTDQGGHSMSRAGTVTTLHRQVDVMYSSITITNDSDDEGTGELKAWDMVPGQIRPNLMMPEDLGDGATVPFNDVMRVRDGGTTLKVSTEVLDNDTFNPFWPTSQLPFPSSPKVGNGSSPEWDWATASTSLATAKATASMVPFQMSVDANVGFVVHGYYWVTFVS